MSFPPVLLSAGGDSGIRSKVEPAAPQTNTYSEGYCHRVSAEAKFGRKVDLLVKAPSRTARPSVGVALGEAAASLNFY